MTLYFQVIPQTIEAIQYTGHNRTEVQYFITDQGLIHDNSDGTLTLYTEGREGRVFRPAWWISKSETGVITVWPPWVFEMMFKPV